MAEYLKSLPPVQGDAAENARSMNTTSAAERLEVMMCGVLDAG